MVALRPIDESNYWECTRLAVAEDQRNFVAGNTFSLAQAYIWRGAVWPEAIFDGGTMVGFTMRRTVDEAMWEIVRLMIDQRYQRRGYGRAALALSLEEIRRDKTRGVVMLTTKNPVAQRMYESFGFVDTGRVDYDEKVLELRYG